PEARANPEAINAIKKADLIIVGPGNHYCSIVPNFLVKGISRAIANSKAKVAYVCNLVNKKGHTEKFDLDDYVDSINKFIGKKRIDFVIFNSKKPNKKLIEKYKSHKELLIKFNPDAIKKRNYKVVKADVLNRKSSEYSKADVLAKQRAFIRHNSDKLAKVLMVLLELDEYKNIVEEII
ncbi:MAG TPA: hypothetical protein DEA27_02980, partial [Candidatus Moranbacteria bacterium]|nr:hypothetical protein [Candidatus Moranbacteria bacterium]